MPHLTATDVGSEVLETGAKDNVGVAIAFDTFNEPSQFGNRRRQIGVGIRNDISIMVKSHLHPAPDRLSLAEIVSESQ